MKVGEYARLKNGYIDKIEELKLQTKYTKYNKLLFEHKVVECLFSDEDLKEIKSSSNIMDLIEKGDYVNGIKVQDVIGCLLVFDGGQDGEWYIETEEDIKSVLTHEQFERMQYNLERKII